MKRAIHCWLISMILILAVFCMNVYAEEDTAGMEPCAEEVTEQAEKEYLAETSATEDEPAKDEVPETTAAEPEGEKQENENEGDPVTKAEPAAEPTLESGVNDKAEPKAGAELNDGEEPESESESGSEPETEHEHVYTPAVTKAATCTEKGVRTFTCACGDSYTEEIIALGHAYKAQVIAPTCTAAGYTIHTCSRCGSSYKDNATNALGHNYQAQVTTPATCEVNGVRTCTCTRCRASYTEAIPMTGHDWGDWTVVKKATNEKEGLKKRTCKNDSTHIEKQVIPAKYPLLGSARRDENGTYSGGKPGDQTGHEIETERWYLHEKGWVVIRAKDDKAREMVATAMEAICAGNKVGYSQSDRYSIFDAGKDIAYDYAMLTKTCNADCSTTVAACVRYSGVDVTPFETDTALIILGETGKFNILTESKYTESPYYLLRGDILVTKTKGHTMVVLENGSKAKLSSVSAATLAITKQPESQTLAIGSRVNLSVTATGSGLDYRWYRRTSTKGAWTLLSDARGKKTYSFTMASRHNGYQYQCVIIDASGKRVASDIITLKVGSSTLGSSASTEKPSALKITKQPESAVVKTGGKATFSVEANGAVSYQWYFRKSSKSSWKMVTAAGGDTASYSPKTDSKHNGYQYRCKVTGSSKSVYSSTAKLTVVTAKPSIKTQPKNKTVTAGKTVTFKIKAKGRALNYQWYYRTSSTGNWKPVTEEAGLKAAYSFTATSKQNGYQFRCIVKNLKGSRTSKTVKLTVR